MYRKVAVDVQRVSEPRGLKMYFLPSATDSISYRYCSISVELRSWSGDGALFTQLDKYRVFFHTSNC